MCGEAFCKNDQTAAPWCRITSTARVNFKDRSTARVYVILSVGTECDAHLVTRLAISVLGLVKHCRIWRLVHLFVRHLSKGMQVNSPTWFRRAEIKILSVSAVLRYSDADSIYMLS